MGRRHRRIVVPLLSLALLALSSSAGADSSYSPGQSAPTNTSLPSIAGVAMQGQALAATTGTWSGPPATFSFQWQRCDSSGGSCAGVGSGPAYGLGSGDVGSTMRVSVTATNKNGSSVATSGQTAVVTSTTPPPPTTTTTTTTTPTTTTGTTTTTPTSGFTTSLVQNGTINTPYTWTFNPGVPTSAGYFWADGVLLAKVTGPGPYSFALQPGKLPSGTHSLGHAWDTTSGTHQAPSSSYTETVDPTATASTTTTTTSTTVPTTTTSSSPSGTVYFDGRAKNMTTLYSYETTPGDTNTLQQGQSPSLWSFLSFLNNDISLTSDGTYGKVFSIRTGYNSHNPYYTPTDGRSSELSVGQPMKLGTWDWYSNAFKVKSGWSQPDWAMLYQFGYPTLSSPPLAISADHTSDGVPRFQLWQNAGLLTNKNNNSTYMGSVVGDTPIVAIPFDTWVQIIVGVKWATDNTGEVHVYYRIPSQSSTWQNPINKTGIPTEQYGTTPYGSCAADFSNCTSVIDHGGLYFGYWTMPSSSNFPTNYVSQMGLSRSSSLATAQSLMP
jgi:hypothetical protein